jgi:hypothetical protein
MKYKVTMMREEKRLHVFEVEAEDSVDAADKALTLSSNHDYREDRVWYSDEYVEEVKLDETDPPIRYYAVTGRVTGDDEETTYCFECRSRDEAVEAFTKVMTEGVHMFEILELYGEFCTHISSVLSSSSPIGID